MTGKAAATVPSTLAPIDEGSATASMGQDPGRVRAASASYAEANKTQAPDQPTGHEENHPATKKRRRPVSKHDSGRFLYRAKTTLDLVVLGDSRRPLDGAWLISTPGSTPAVQRPVGMIVSISC